ncbi:MAG: RNA polymerase factor sigma-54 [Bacteroidota bacterium]|jgi:RNA polymerase sigma-54 factor
MLKQSLQQKLLQKLSPQQIQLMKLLQVTTLELDQRIKEEIEINPALEEGSDEPEKDDENFSDLDYDHEEEAFENKENSREDFNLDEYIDDDEIPSYKLQVKNNGEDDDRREIPITGTVSFQDTLVNQLGMVTMDDYHYQLALTVIGNIDDNGYLVRDLLSMSDDLVFSQNIQASEDDLLDVLRVIQSFDPPGVGARNLKECLEIQLRRKIALHSQSHSVLELALSVVTQQMEEFSKKHYEKIQKKLNLSDEMLKQVIAEILHLNPRPGNSVAEGKRSSQHITPDFMIYENDGRLELTLNSRNAPELRVSRAYKEMLQEYAQSKLGSKDKKEAVQFVKQKIDAASWFIDAIKQRQHTLLMTMQAIMEYQYEFFNSGDETKLKPMILKDIAERVNLDISTVSRVANSKYVQTAFGTMLIKSLFSESLSTDAGEEVSTKEVKKILQDHISAENKRKPLTDEKLCEILKENGYNIARRTVAKYREQLNLPVARLRKEL